MLKKWPKPGFVISAELHSKIAQSCIVIQETDSQISDVRRVKPRFKNDDQKKTLTNEFVYNFANH